jgi:hypothetical protein
MFVCCECCVLLGRGLCDELITNPEKSYWLLFVVLFYLETSWMRRPWPTGGLSRHKTNKRTNKQTTFLKSCKYLKLLYKETMMSTGSLMPWLLGSRSMAIEQTERN